jgi:hypothetical protein
MTTILFSTPFIPKIKIPWLLSQAPVSNHSNVFTYLLYLLKGQRDEALNLLTKRCSFSTEDKMSLTCSITSLSSTFLLFLLTSLSLHFMHLKKSVRQLRL